MFSKVKALVFGLLLGGAALVFLKFDPFLVLMVGLMLGLLALVFVDP